MIRRRNKGFTLIELMVVVVIVAVLATMAIPNFVRYHDQSLRSKCLSNLRMWQSARESFFADHPTMTAFNTGNNTDIVPYFAGITVASKLPTECPADTTKKYSILTFATELNTLPSCPFTVTRSGGVTVNHVLELY